MKKTHKTTNKQNAPDPSSLWKSFYCKAMAKVPCKFALALLLSVRTQIYGTICLE